ncbi:MAG: UDP-N-acetylmuramoyl-tripeptide--D-alanyl-D-alanine ligase, partial [Anaerolineae bacterium]|nr:UDP-N-acetylmuramoyl-tripeptide--D-alanyl-D-alanine ligase [Anaerolineae bacterium]
AMNLDVSQKGETQLVPPVAVVVRDPLASLQRFARVRREAARGLRVVGVTGSVGKTTAKELIATVLEQRYRVLKSWGNYNNEIGLPLTLMDLEPSHQYAVLEMGMYAQGEIAQLCEIAQPQIGVVMNVEPVHLERLGSIERIAEAKAELVEALPRDGVAVLNGDDPRVRAMASKCMGEVVTFGLGPENDLWAEKVMSKGLEGVRFLARAASRFAGRGGAKELRLRMLGRHVVMPALAAAAVGLLEGLSWEEIAQGLEKVGYGLRLVPKRGKNGILLLDDTYNASPPSTIAALEAMAELPGRHIAVLGDMLELGTWERRGHREVGKRCAHLVDVLIAVGERARWIAEGALEADMPSGSVHWVKTNKDATILLEEIMRSGDNVLIKGSRGMAMEEIVEAWEERD